MPRTARAPVLRVVVRLLACHVADVVCGCRGVLSMRIVGVAGAVSQVGTDLGRLYHLALSFFSELLDGVCKVSMDHEFDA